MTPGCVLSTTEPPGGRMMGEGPWCPGSVRTNRPAVLLVRLPSNRTCLTSVVVLVRVITACPVRSA